MVANQNITRLDRLIFYFAVIDIFFLPYFRFLAITNSQFIVFLWFIVRGHKLCNRREVRAYMWFIALMVVSNLVAIVLVPSHVGNDVLVDNWKRGVNIAVSISYYFLFVYYMRNSNVNTWKWVFALVCYITLWALLYYTDLNSFFHYKEIFNPRDSTMLGSDDRSISFRFNFIWTDPNNVGYTIVALATALIINKHTPNTFMALSIIFASFVMLLTMSMGTMISGFIFIPLSLAFRIKENQSIVNMASMVIFVLMAIYIGVSLSSDIMSSAAAKTSMARLEMKEEQGDDRPKIWRKLLESKSIPAHAIVGEGSNIFVDGKIYSPHSGHLMLIFSYGLIAYLLFMYLLFRKPRWQSLTAYIPTLPFLFCFTSNIGIGEIKFVGVMAFVIAYMRIYNIRQIKTKPNV